MSTAFESITRAELGSCSGEPIGRNLHASVSVGYPVRMLRLLHYRSFHANEAKWTENRLFLYNSSRTYLDVSEISALFLSFSRFATQNRRRDFVINDTIGVVSHSGVELTPAESICIVYQQSSDYIN
jgi:hypothetical protein